MKIATYSRVSTESQTVDSQTLELETFCAGKGWQIAERFEDVISGAKWERPGLAALMERVNGPASERGFDAVCCVKLDRMARSMGHFAEIIEEFERADVALIFTSQGIDTSRSNACGRLQMGVLIAVAAFERDLIRERTKAGLAVARAKGVVLGKPSAKLVGVDVPAVVAAWRAETDGFDVRLLATRLGGVSVSTAWRLAKKWEGKTGV